VQRLVAPLADDGRSRRPLLEVVREFARAVDQELDVTESTHAMLVLGVRVSGETPVAWLATHMTCVDNFLHVVLKPC